MKNLASGYFYLPEPRPAPAPPPHQQRVDAIVAEARKNKGFSLLTDSPPPPPPLEPSDDVLDARLAEELHYVQRILEGMSDELCDNAFVLQRFGQTLQGFDRASQILGHISKIVSSKDKEEAVERIGMQDLRTRLKRQRLF